MREKRFFLQADQIKRLVRPMGSCFATDRIIVDGEKVGYMYREPPDNDGDSGWRFLAGDESGEYLDDADNMAIYDVNTVANYDPEIIPYLNAKSESAYARDPQSGKFVPVAFQTGDA